MVVPSYTFQHSSTSKLKQFKMAPMPVEESFKRRFKRMFSMTLQKFKRCFKMDGSMIAADLAGNIKVWKYPGYKQVWSFEQHHISSVQKKQ